MVDPQKLESLLVADIGSVTTKLGLVDRVGDEFRVVSSSVCATTAEPPFEDVVVGVRRGIELLEERTGRRFVSDEGGLLTPERAGGLGVDAFAVIASAPEPLRVAIVGISREVSLASAIRAIQGTYATLEATLALDQTGGRWLPAKEADSKGDGDENTSGALLQDPAVVAAEELARARPDVVVIAGGIDGGATTPLYELANLVATIVASRDEASRPTIVFAGNRDARSQIAARIGQIAPFRVVDNVRPSLEVESLTALQRELEALYIETKIAWLPGMNALASWTPLAVTPAARAFENVARFVARRYDLNVLAADLGAVSTTIVSVRGNRVSRVVRADLGLGQNLENVITHAGLEQLVHWLPLEMDADTARTHWLNHALHPAEIPVSRQDAHLMQAAARAALSITVRESGLDVDGIDLVLLTGRAFAHNSNFGALALLALDALQPTGIFTLATDVLGLTPAFGALAPLNAAAAAAALERDGFLTLGTVIAPTSSLREGQVALRVRIEGLEAGTLNLEVQQGSLELVPLPTGHKASIEIRASQGVRLGGRRPGYFKAQVEGGALGLIIDARGRPIHLLADAEKRRGQLQKWFWDIGGEVGNG